MSNLPTKGWPSAVTGDLISVISDFIKKPEIREFYLGRTNDLISTKSRHNCDDIFPLYETNSTDNAIIVEDTLNKIFYKHRKCNNEADHGGGGASDDC